MARAEKEPARHAPRLFLILPAQAVAGAGGLGALAGILRKAGEVVDIAAVMLRLAPGETTASAARLAPLVAAIHDISAACLVEGSLDLVGTLDADGAHLDGIAALNAALPALRPHRIAGAGGLRTKHDAMSAGEAGADYVMFGEADAGGRTVPFDTVLERTEWWAQLFELPCVAYARTMDEVAALVAVGTDFVAVDALLLDAPETGARALAAALLVEEG
ncbi:thiamine phosphate synthase [Ancylobacter lacus]|uniref:thiamine phosphate synthase n=1 Tax=Ancylobacter lacus TaxID=2579970 RepID=UPI001BCBD6EF|nr:thiamine phosphate synthase [Ancylobacter lacus]MBS7540212.1 thiamine phosphate synthase [Ancylobacter lacus]